MPELFYTYAKAQTLISDLIDEVIDEANPDDFPMNEVFNVSDMKRGEHVSYRVAGLDRPEQREYLEDLAPVNYKEGEKFTKKPLNWGAQLAIPKELIEDLADAGPGDGEIAARIGAYTDFVREMKFTGFWRADTECADKLTNGTSTAAKYVGRDGVALFSASQTSLGNPVITQSNVTSNLSLTENNLMTVITSIQTQKDDRGAQLRNPTKYTLVTGPALDTKGWQILNTDKQTDSANNTKNRVFSMKSSINQVCWKELGASYTGWFVLAEGHQVNFKWRKKPTFDKESDLSTNSLRYGMTMRGVAFHESWRKTAASIPA